ncbi:unnamed protein product [Sphenostylis stenocarpa]|uniref:Uncharacterized protein n=1 Tax=Sphenostylis stenocarpa TaxID=92480 RepID=A0AA86TFN7_9FABA|nr:unnamed protein product [Sphenostylis stenocarpa]
MKNLKDFNLGMEWQRHHKSSSCDCRGGNGDCRSYNHKGCSEDRKSGDDNDNNQHRCDNNKGECKVRQSYYVQLGNLIE